MVAQVNAVAVEPVPPLIDPVCGMTVPAQSPHVFKHKGERIVFCSASCSAKFVASPEKYPTIPAATAATRGVPSATEAGYTCPMHPEVQQAHPGVCPKCGMALEPVMPTLDDGANPELQDFLRRFLWTLPLTIIVTLLAMVRSEEHTSELQSQ